jgi:hypothetical protein
MYFFMIHLLVADTISFALRRRAGRVDHGLIHAARQPTVSTAGGAGDTFGRDRISSDTVAGHQGVQYRYRHGYQRNSSSRGPYLGR